MSDPDWSDWPLEKPLTTAWCLRHIVEHGVTPLAFHNRWTSDGRLSEADSGVLFHETCLRI
eukprot:5598570-Lingulodinium_polyedra.AAC.1